MEGTRVDVATEFLESAMHWLQAHPTLPWREDLMMRLDLRIVRSLTSRSVGSSRKPDVHNLE